MGRVYCAVPLVRYLGDSLDYYSMFPALDLARRGGERNSDRSRQTPRLSEPFAEC